jgi:hypothetical protein
MASSRDGVAQFRGVAEWMLKHQYSWCSWSSGPSGKRVQQILVLHNPDFDTGRTASTLRARVIVTEEAVVIADAPATMEAGAGESIVDRLAMAIAAGNQNNAKLSYATTGRLAEIMAGKVSWGQSIPYTQAPPEPQQTVDPPKIVMPKVVDEPPKSTSSMSLPLIGGGLLLAYLLLRRR